MTDRNENPDEELFCRQFDHGVALLGREANEAAQDSKITGPDETGEFLRKDAREILKGMVTYPDWYSEDSFRTMDCLLKATALLATNRMLTHSRGFQFETIDAPEPHLRIYVPPDRHLSESVDIRLNDIPWDTSAVPGHFTVTDRPAVSECVSGVTEQTEFAKPLVHTGYLLMQQIQKGDTRARLSRGLCSDATSLHLAQSARSLLEEQAANPAAWNNAPHRMQGRMLKAIALLAVDQMLSHQHGVNLEGLSVPDHCIRIYAPVERHPPERFDLRLPGVSTKEI